MRSDIDHSAHLFGFIGGVIFSFLFGPRLFYKEGSLGRRIIDRPLVNYIKPWNKFKNSDFLKF